MSPIHWKVPAPNCLQFAHPNPHIRNGCRTKLHPDYSSTHRRGLLVRGQVYKAPSTDVSHTRTPFSVTPPIFVRGFVVFSFLLCPRCRRRMRYQQTNPRLSSRAQPSTVLGSRLAIVDNAGLMPLVKLRVVGKMAMAQLMRLRQHELVAIWWWLFAVLQRRDSAIRGKTVA